MKLTRPLAVLDSEWTSANPRRTRMLSLAVLRIEPNGPERSHEWRFNPGCPIEAGAQAVHGITAEAAAREAPFRDHAATIEQTIAGCDIGGYAVRNDLVVLAAELARCGRDFTLEGRHVVDGYQLWIQRDPRTLKNAYAKFVGPLPADAALHDAAYDAKVTREVLEALAGDARPEDLHRETQGELVDIERRFRRNENGIVVLGFGEHIDEPALNHPDYLEWMLRKDFAHDTKTTCRKLLDLVQRASRVQQRNAGGTKS